MTWTNFRLDPDIGLAIVDPTVELVDGRLLLSWPERSSRVVIESQVEIDAARTRAVYASGARLGRSVRRVRTDSSIADLADAVVVQDVGAAAAAHVRSDDLDLQRLVVSMMQRDRGQPVRLRAADDHIADTLARLHRHFSVRCLLAVAPGVLARSKLDVAAMTVLDAEMLAACGDHRGALDALQHGPRVTTLVLHRVALLRTSSADEEIVRLTDEITNIDPISALLCIERGRSLGRIGDAGRASASFSEALRVTRIAQVIKRRAVLARAAGHIERGHIGRAIADLRRVHAHDADVIGLDRVIRSLRARR